MQVIDWQVVVNKHGPMVWKTAYRLLANYTDTADCFQETFASALEVSRRQHVRNFPALLARLATARAIDQLRQRLHKSHASTDLTDWATVPGDNPEPIEELQTQELAANLRKALAQIPPQQAQAFCLRYLDNMSYRRIAKELGIKTSAAGVLLHRARAKLRDLLENAAVIEERQV